MNPKNVTYKEMKNIQIKDMQSKSIVIDIYRSFSTPFTWFFVRLGVSPNFITISSYFLCIIGGFILSLGTYISFLFGILPFVLFRIFDDSDGEVARIQNKKSIEGLFFDSLGHYIYNFFIGLGLGIGLYKLYGGIWYMVIGLFFGFMFILQDIARDTIKLLIRQIIINHKIRKTSQNEEGLYNHFEQRFNRTIYNEHKWEKGKAFSKIFGVYPFQGVIFSDRIVIIILFILFLIEFFTNSLGFSIGDNISLSLIYITAVIISKFLWLMYILLRITDKRPFTDL